MRRWRVLWFLPLIVFGMAGCTQPAAPLLPLDQTAKIEVKVKRLPGPAGANISCEFSLTKRADLDEVITWLKGIDWSQEGIDLTVAKVPEADGEIVVTHKDGSTQDFGFFWDGRLVHRRANRLLQGGDIARLKKLTQRECE